MRTVKRFTSSIIVVLLVICHPIMTLGQTSLAKSVVLDAALSLLEQGNPFVTSYNQITKSAVEATFPLGVPYFFGGRAYDKILRMMQPWQNSNYYKEENYYIYGFDCVGYTTWVLRQAGRPNHPAINELLDRSGPYQEKLLPFTDLPYEEIPTYAQPGDLLVLKQPKSRHSMLYIGTLRQFGYEESKVESALAPYLDYPLMAHCGPNQTYFDTYTEYIKYTFKISKVTPPDGGVMVSLLGPSPDVAPHTMPIPGIPAAQQVMKYFLVDGYPLTVYNVFTATSQKWVRW